MPALLAADGRFAAVTDHRDLAGRPRFATASRRTDGPHAAGRGVADWLLVMLYDCRSPADRDRGIAAAIEAVKNGELVVLPTDTVYGIGADAFTPYAVTALLDAKGRRPAHAAAGAGRLPAHPRRPGLLAARRRPGTWSRRSGRAR